MVISRWIFKMTNVSEKCHQNTYFMFKNFFRKSRRLWYDVKQHGGAWQTTDGNKTRCKKKALCLINNYGKNTDSHSQYLIFIASWLINFVSSRKMFNGNTLRTDNVRIARHRRAVFETSLQWKSNMYYIFWVCVCSLIISGMQCACFILSSVACPAIQYLTNGTNYEKKGIEHKMYVLIFSTALV